MIAKRSALYGALLVFAVGCTPAASTESATTTTTQAAAPSVTTPVSFVVSRVVDGDTLVVEPGTKIRLLSVDSPETVDPHKPVQCYGPEASKHLKELLPAGTVVTLEHEKGYYDRYGRELAQVYRASDHLHVNAELVQDGYARVMVVSPNTASKAQFEALEAEAKAAHRGLWGACS